MSVDTPGTSSESNNLANGININEVDENIVLTKKLIWSILDDRQKEKERPKFANTEFQILDTIVYPEFQPVVCATKGNNDDLKNNEPNVGDTSRYEALMRIKAKVMVDNEEETFVLYPDRYTKELRERNKLEEYKKSVFQVIEQSVFWAKEHNTKININFGKEEFKDPEYYEFLLECCKKYDIPPHRITLEILEEIKLSEYEEIIGLKRLQTIKKAGFNIYIDDFLSELYIKGCNEQDVYRKETKALISLLPDIHNIVTTIKIDKYFVWEMFSCKNPEGDPTFNEIKARNRFFNLMTIFGGYKDIKFVLEGIEENRLEETLEFLNQKFPDREFFIQSFATGKSNEKPINKEQDTQNKQILRKN